MVGVLMISNHSSGCRGGEQRNEGTKSIKAREQTPPTTTVEQNQLSLIALLISAIRKSMITCRLEERDEVSASVHHMDIGWPTNVQHIAHVTFDRFHGFLGLPVEFEVEVLSRAPSASISVFGVSAGSMQCSNDSRGNSVPTILLLMQERLYTQGGLKAEGIFRINPENSQEEHVRDQLNRGIVPDDIDVHCLAGLIKAWFRELPEGILDGLSAEQVLQSNTEEECVELMKQLDPIPAALLNWAVDLMVDVVEEEEFNKMNARNIAMVFAPNMTQMSDPLTALMHAVQVMNLLKTLIVRTLRERDEASTGGYSPFYGTSSDRQSYEDYDSQQEMDLSCELKTTIEEYNDNGNNSHSSGDEDEVESLKEIEECFLRKIHGNDNVTSNVDIPEESAEHASSPFSSPTSDHNADVYDLSVKNESVCLSSNSEDVAVTIIIAQEDSVHTDITIEKYVDVEILKEEVNSLPDFSS